MHKLHNNVAIVSAGNKVDDGAAVTGEMSTALKSRMAHINIEVSLNAWMDWALAANVHHSITSWLKFKPAALYDFDPTADRDTFPCPRTWAMANKAVETVGLNDPLIRPMLGAILSDGAATEYLNFCNHFANLPNFEDILKDPEGTDVPEGLSTLYALSGSIGAQTNKDNVATVMKYIARMKPEFQLRTFTDFTKRDPLTATVDVVRAWMLKEAKGIVTG